MVLYNTAITPTITSQLLMLETCNNIIYRTMWQFTGISTRLTIDYGRTLSSPPQTQKKSARLHLINLFYPLQVAAISPALCLRFLFAQLDY